MRNYKSKISFKDYAKFDHGLYYGREEVFYFILLCLNLDLYVIPPCLRDCYATLVVLPVLK